jgi:AcrR family transcriptional regulator
MARWEPDAQGRLVRAAIELFTECGYEQTTVAEIAARAGLTERTFFRHYGDKREVLFGGGDQFRDAFVDKLEGALASMSALEAVTIAAQGAGAALEERVGRDFAAARQHLIRTNPALRERELMKIADVTAAMAATLRAHGVEEPDASMTAELGMAGFRVGFDRWLAPDEDRTLPGLIHGALSRLPTVVG